jgi:hypothetical protein
MASSLEYLYNVADAQTGVSLYQFSRATEMDMSFTRPTATFAVPGQSGGYDPRGVNPNDIAPRTLPYKFQTTLVPGVDTHASKRSAILTAIGNKRLKLQLLYPDGSFRTNNGKLTAWTDKVVIEKSLTVIEWEMTFSLEGAYWRSLVPSGVLIYDGGFIYDAAVSPRNYDSSNVLALSAAAQSITITNHGDAPEFEGVYTFQGPWGSPFILASSVLNKGGIAEQFLYFGTDLGYNVGTGIRDTLIVDTGAQTVIRNGVPDRGNFDFGGGTAQAEWMRLDPGVNTLTVFHNGGVTGGFCVVQAFDSFF